MSQCDDLPTQILRHDARRARSPVDDRSVPGSLWAGRWARTPTLEDELGPAENARLTAAGSIVDTSRQTVVFTPGEHADALYTVLSGVVRIFASMPDGRRQIIGFMHPGDFLGFAYEDVYACGAEAVTDVRLRRYGRRAFLALCERTPNLERALLRIAAHELTMAQDHMVMLGRQSARERVASFLCQVARRTLGLEARGTSLWLPMPQADIADYLGLSVETVSRVLTWFKQTGAIRSRSRDIVEILDFTSLERIAGEA